MSDYAKAKGRTAFPAGKAPVSHSTAPRALSPAETDAVARNKVFVLENMPELVPFIHELHQLGLIDGWRAVSCCKKESVENVVMQIDIPESTTTSLSGDESPC